MNRAPGYLESDNNEDEDFKPLTAQEAQRIVKNSPKVSLARLIVWQVGSMVVLALLAWLIARESGAVLSVVYGSVAVMLPAVLFMKGMSKLRESGGKDAGSALVLFMACEFGKIVLAALLLFLAPRVLGAELNWISLLAGVIVTLKTYWVALWVQLRSGN